MWLQNSDVIIEDKRHYLKDICLSRKIFSVSIATILCSILLLHKDQHILTNSVNCLFINQLTCNFTIK